MNALAHLRPDAPGSPDLALLFAAVEAFPESLAIVGAGIVLYTNPAWAKCSSMKVHSSLWRIWKNNPS